MTDKADEPAGEGAGGSASDTSGGSAGGRWVPPEPGPLAQEAALLAAAVRDWLTAHGAPPPSAPPAAGQDAEPGNAEGRGGESGDAGG
ncbi:MAG: hypothetical protein IRZ08_19430, partial [Frankia sp.]|nr:hypothetical protein [Frankia sp.]